jgi:hypothetical protein
MFVDERVAAPDGGAGMGGALWLAADSAAMRRYPPGSGREGRFSAALIARSTRPAAWSSVSALVGSLSTTLVRRRAPVENATIAVSAPRKPR